MNHRFPQSVDIVPNDVFEQYDDAAAWNPMSMKNSRFYATAVSPRHSSSDANVEMGILEQSRSSADRLTFRPKANTVSSSRDVMCI
jgi:hypothetical protein